jgi:large subunit ribosomal protein L22
MNTDALYISEIHADPGPIIKRFRARAHGRGASILKRTSHISIVVKEKE